MHHTTNQTTVEAFTNALCRDIGHDWKPTPVPDYRLCQRTKCKAAQRLHQGRWMDVTTRPAAHHTKTLPCHTEQATIIWAGPEPSQQGA